MSSVQFGRVAQADFFTTTHRISGQVNTGPKPLSDMLNDRSLSFVMAVNVYVSRLWNRARSSPMCRRLIYQRRT